MSAVAKGSLLECQEISGTIQGWWWERGRQFEEIKASRNGDRERFRPPERVLLTSPRKQCAVVFPLRPRHHLPLLA